MWESHLAEDETSYSVPRSTADLQGFCANYPLRRHRFEHKANEGSFELRADWEHYIGPIERWGSCNPWEGHFGAVVLPFCKPERVAITSYIFEYAFMYDNVVESVAKAKLNDCGDNITLDETEYRTVRSITGTKQIQSKMLLELLSIDRPCAEVVIDSWKEMISTTAKQDKTRAIDNLEEYVQYRIVDTGAPFVDMVMRFGMGILLTPEENALTALIVRPCYAALGLANDYFSFDVEWEEFNEKQTDEKAMTNAVWLFMQWENLDIPAAKKRVQQVVNDFEKEYLDRVDGFIAGEGKDNKKLHTYLISQGHQVPGNITWSLRCPRYHPDLCDEGDSILKTEGGEQSERKQSDSPFSGSRSHSETNLSDVASVWSGNISPRSSVSSAPSSHGEQLSTKHVTLGSEHLLAPAEYVSSLPSKGVREAFIDALNVWLVLPDNLVKELKSIGQTLHNTSLMLDDIEDSSPLRRGWPATHTIFGEAQTINSANFLLIKVMGQIRELNDPHCLSIFLEEMENLFIGQSFDLYWTQHGQCPSQEEYLEMIRQKTGGLFRLIARLTAQKSTAQHNRNISLDHLVDLMGQYFQIRDDYKNLTPEYTGQKGFCEDLDEGKFSFPLIHALRTQPKDMQLRGILQQSRTRTTETLDIPIKQQFMSRLEQAGSMKYTEKVLHNLMSNIMGEIDAVERKTDTSNFVLRLLVHRLRV